METVEIDTAIDQHILVEIGDGYGGKRAVRESAHKLTVAGLAAFAQIDDLLAR